MEANATSTTVSSMDPVITAADDNTTSIQSDVDKTNSTTTTAPPPPLSTEAIPVEEPPPSPSHIRRESNISEIDPNAFKITILLASSGYRIHISVNRSFLEKTSSVEGDGFLVSQLKNAIWKDWPSGIYILRV